MGKALGRERAWLGQWESYDYCEALPGGPRDMGVAMTCHT